MISTSDLNCDVLSFNSNESSVGFFNFIRWSRKNFLFVELERRSISSSISLSMPDELLESTLEVSLMLCLREEDVLMLLLELVVRDFIKSRILSRFFSFVGVVIRV